MQRPILLSGIIGIALIVIGVIITVIGPGHSDKLADGFFTPVIAFEFATEPEDIIQVFGEANSPAREDIVRSMTNSTRSDFLFLILYGAFLFTFSITCASLTGNRVYYLPVLLSIVAPIFDVLENLQLLTIMRQMGDGDFVSELPNLHFYTWMKWGVLVLIFLLLIPFFRTAGTFGRFLSIYAVVPLILGILAFLKPGLSNELFALSTVLMFFLMIIFSFTYRKNR
jgi:hypothetical protein